MLYQNKSKSIYTACCMPRMVPVASHLFILQSSKHASQSWLHNLYSPRQYENAWCIVKIGEHKLFPFFHALNPSRDICRVKADLHRCPGPPLSLTVSTCITCWSASAWPWAQAPLKAKGGRGISRRSNSEPLEKWGGSSRWTTCEPRLQDPSVCLIVQSDLITKHKFKVKMVKNVKMVNAEHEIPRLGSYAEFQTIYDITGYMPMKLLLTPKQKCHYYLHFTDEETEAQRRWWI